MNISSHVGLDRHPLINYCLNIGESEHVVVPLFDPRVLHLPLKSVVIHVLELKEQLQVGDRRSITDKEATLVLV